MGDRHLFGDTKDFFSFDPTTETWTRLPDFPGPGRGFSIGGAVYKGEGYLGFGSTTLSKHFFNDLWKYNPQTGQWTQLADCPCAGREHPAFVLNEKYGKIFVGQGNGSGSGGHSGGHGGGGDFKDWWEYDIATNTWKALPDVPGLARHHPYHFSINNSLIGIT